MPKSAQGVTGLEAKRLISDDCLEATTAADGGDDDSDSDSESGSSAESDASDFVTYKVKIVYWTPIGRSNSPNWLEKRSRFLCFQWNTFLVFVSFYAFLG